MPPMGPAFLAMFRAGVSPATAKMMTEVGTPAALAALLAWRHLRRVEEPGHFDVLDDECAERLRLTPEERAHIDEWPTDHKEAMRLLSIEAIRTGQPIRVIWRVVRRTHRMAVRREPDASTTVLFGQPHR